MTSLPIMPIIELATSGRSSCVVTLGHMTLALDTAPRKAFCRLAGTYPRPDVPASFGTRLLNIGTHSALDAAHERASSG